MGEESCGMILATVDKDKLLLLTTIENEISSLNIELENSKISKQEVLEANLQ